MYVNHSKFVKHSSCERCGSRDNVAWYSNGTGFCFGCGAFYRDRTGDLRSNYASVPSAGRTNTTTDTASATRCSGVSTPTERGTMGGEESVSLRSPPADIGTYYPTTVVDWMKQYNVSVTDMMRFNVKWSPSREQLIYLFYGEGKDLVLWQARNFRAGTAHKDRFFTGGRPEEVIAAYYPEQGDGKTAVIVEDCVSGIKLAKSGFAGIPVFGAKMSAEKMRGICRMYENVIWWLDSDKFKESVKQSNLCKLLGANSRVVNTAYDPKEYSVAEVHDLLEEF